MTEILATRKFVKSLNDDELEMLFIGNLPDNENYDDEISFYESMSARLDIHFGIPTYMQNFDFDIFRKIEKELGLQTNKSRIEKYLGIANDCNWQTKHKQWKRLVHERDDYSCQNCGTNKNLHAHHVIPRSEFPEIQFELDNGITLCKKCHFKIHHSEDGNK